MIDFPTIRLSAPLAGTLLACTVLNADAHSQSTVVWPANYANMPGDASMSSPFATSGLRRKNTSRSITTISAASAPFGVGSVITEIAFRRDTSHPGESYGAVNGSLAVYIGRVDDAMRPIASMNQVFPAGRTVVIKNRISVPASPPPASGTTTPAPFDFVVPFRFPWTYTGGDFAIDIAFESDSPNTWRRDAVALGGDLPGLTTHLGEGCPGSSGRTPFSWVDRHTALAGGGGVEITLEGAALPIGLPAMLVLGLPSPTPLDLTTVGMPNGCELHITPTLLDIVLTGGASTRFGRAISVTFTPIDPVLTGNSVSAQWLVSDPGQTSQLSWVASNAFEFVIGAAAPPATLGRALWSYGYDRGGSQGGELGEINYVPVIRFGGTLLP